jgi:hypothetical protein
MMREQHLPVFLDAYRRVPIVPILALVIMVLVVLTAMTIKRATMTPVTRINGYYLVGRVWSVGRLLLGGLCVWSVICLWASRRSVNPE